jgi:hypothetical protein
MATKIANERTHDEVVRWRHDQLIASGFSPSTAARLATDPRYDLHALIELVERGCSPDLAVRIVAPLDADVAA